MNGIAVAGSALVDEINIIKEYPAMGRLTQVYGVNRSVGGLVPNVGVDIKRIAPDLSVYAYGKVGKDDKAEFLLDTLRRNGVNADGIKRAETLGTSFTQVMSVEGGERTFFTYAGASADFGYDDIDFDKITAKILTSIDLVSSANGGYEKVLPCLPFVDYLIINELEAAALCKSDNTDDLRFLAEKLKAMGVKEGVIIHKEDKACFLGENYAEINSLIVPDKLFKGKTGAGDAFCAGALTEIYVGATPQTILETGVRVAAASIMQSNATDGVKTKSEIYEITRNFKKR